MTTLYKLLENIIEKTIKEYSEKIIKEYNNVSIIKLEELWEETLRDEGLDNKKVKKDEGLDNKKVKCPYEFSKGKRKGEICNIKLSIGKDYCSSHNKSDVKKDKINNSILLKENIIETEKKKIDNNFRILKKNIEIDCWWNSFTGMVFKNNQERIVIGRIKEGKKCKLNKEDIEDCKKWNYQYEIDNIDEKKTDNNKEDIREKSIEDILGIILDIE
jgi:hypothetical protein